MTAKLYTTSFFLAPLCFALSSFFWQSDGQYIQYSVTSGTLLIIGSIFWVFVFIALFDLLKDKAPQYATWGLLISIYGCLCGGVAFALRDVASIAFQIQHKAMLEAFARYPVFDNLVFWIGGPAFPSSLLILGIVLAATKKAPVWTGVMIAISAALFPVSRIFRVEWIAHADDLLMLMSLGYMGSKL